MSATATATHEILIKEHQPDFPRLDPSWYPILCSIRKPLLSDEIGKDRPFSLASASITFLFLGFGSC